MRKHSLWLLAAIAALLGAIVVLDEDDAPERPLVRERLLPRLARDQVQSLWIKPAHGPALVLLRDRRLGGFRLGGRRGLPADEGVVEELLSALEFAEIVRKAPPGTRRRALGLDPPRLKLRIRQRSELRVIDLSFGAPDVSGRGLYVGRSADIVVVPASLYGRADLAPRKVQKRELVPFAVDEIDRLRAKDETGATLELVRRGDDWSVAARGGRIRAVEEEVYRLLGALSTLRADELALLPKGQPVSGAALELQLSAGPEQVKLTRGAACADGTRRSIVREWGGVRARACIAGDAFAGLRVDPTPYYERVPTALSLAQLARLRIEREGRLIDLVREGARWLFTTDGHEAKVEADEESLRRWLDALGRLSGEIEPGVAAEASEASSGFVRVALWPERGTRQDLHFGRPSKRGVPLRRDEEPALLWLDASALTLLELDASALRSRRVLAFEIGELNRIAIMPEGRAREVVVRSTRARSGAGARIGGDWMVSAPARVEADDVRMATLVGRLAALRARRFVEPDALAHRPALGRIELSFGPPRSAKVVLTLRRAASEGCLVRPEEGPPYEIDEEDCELLLSPKAGRQLFQVDAARVSRIAFRWPGTTRDLRRRGHHWYAGSQRLETPRVEQLIGWISRLEAERVLDYAPAGDGAAQAPWRISIMNEGGQEQRCVLDAAGRTWCAGRAVVYQMSKAFARQLRDPISPQGRSSGPGTK